MCVYELAVDKSEAKFCLFPKFNVVIKQCEEIAKNDAVANCRQIQREISSETI